MASGSAEVVMCTHGSLLRSVACVCFLVFAGATPVQSVRPLVPGTEAVVAGSSAIGRRSMPASTNAAFSRSRLDPVGPLQLMHGGACQPGWLPTFGGQPGM